MSNCAVESNGALIIGGTLGGSERGTLLDNSKSMIGNTHTHSLYVYACGKHTVASIACSVDTKC